MTDAELAELDLAVAKAEGLETDAQHLSYGRIFVRRVGWTSVGELRRWEEHRPTRDGAEAMRLLEKYEIAVTRWFDGVRLSRWIATASEGGVRSGVVNGEGETPAIAICRAVIALKGAKP